MRSLDEALDDLKRIMADPTLDRRERHRRVIETRDAIVAGIKRAHRRRVNQILLRASDPCRN